MTDLQVLFHNPEALNDSDLAMIKRKINQQRLLPFLTAASAGGSMFVLESAIFKRRAYNPYVLGAATVAGFLIGGVASSRISMNTNAHLYSEGAQDSMDADIIRAFN